MSSFNLQDAVQALADGALVIENEVPSRSIDGALDSAIDSISDSSDAITVPIVFDAFRSGLKHAQQLEPGQLNKIQDALSSAFRTELDATARDGQDLADSAAYRSHKTALEMYAFLSMWFVQVAEKYVNTARAGDDEAGPAAKKKTAKGKGKAAKGKGDFQWADSIPAVLALFAKALRLKTERIWQTTQERDSFVGCFTRPANRFAETEVYMKNVDTRMAVYKVICIGAKFHGQSFATQIMIMQNMTAYEHLPEPMAELVHILATEFDLSQIGEEVLREIADKNFSGGTDAKSQKPFPRFLIKLSELMPRLIHKQMVVLQKHLDSESYHMRNAIIEVLGNLIRDVANSEDETEPGQQKRELENFFGLLFDRFLDLNGFVRSKVVTVFSRILDIQSNRFAEARLRLTALAVRSLEDKTSTVRKNCLALLIKLILTHPYGALHGGELDLAEFSKGYEVVCAELEPMEAPSQEVLDAMRDEQEADDAEDDAALKVKAEPASDDDDANDEEDEESSDEDESKEERAAKKAAAKAQRKARTGAGKARKSEVAINAAFAQIDQEKLGKLRLTKRYYTDAMIFISELQRAIPLAATLLASKMKAEVLESMEFFKTAYEYKLEGADEGVKKMLHLIWAKDNSTVEDGQELKGIRSRLIECYRSLYFDALKDLSPVDNVNRIARNMITLTFNATLADLTSLEQLMSIMMAENAVHDDVIHKLWQAYSTSKDIPHAQRRGAIIILGQLAIAKPEIITENLEYLLKIGLGQHGKADYLLAKYSCIALVRIGGSQKKVKGSLADKSVRLEMDNAIFDRLRSSILNSKVDQEWFGLSEQIINTIYALGEQPDALCSDIIQELARNVFGKAASHPGKRESPEAELQPAETGAEAGEDQSEPGDAPEPSQTQARQSAEPGRTQSAEPPALANAFQLAQLLFASGHIATRHLLHLELMEREAKRRKAESDKQEAAKEPVEKQDLDQVVGSVEDDIAEGIAAAKEKELLYGPDSLLAIFGPMAVAVCSQPKLYKNHMLRVAAVSAMSKFMCVSAQFCEEHLMLLFKLLETADNPVIRSNIVIALGDIAVCFSTLMDQNSDRLYAGLTDKDLTVKKNTLMVLTHLILNGMIKVKGQLGEMAKCLEDEEERISSLAKLFFEELSTKENAIYNNLPDIISHLSVGKHAVDEETYKKIMKYIFRYIEKEKQAESIVDKLCQRFRVVTDERQWRDIAFCMSLLPFKSERSVKRLVEGLPFYQDKLRDDKVYEYFLDILNKARSTKAVKNENDLLEFEKALEEHKRVGQENAAIEQKAQKKTRKKAAASAPAPAAAKSKGKGRTRQQTTESPPSSPVAPPAKSKGKARARKQTTESPPASP